MPTVALVDQELPVAMLTTVQAKGELASRPMATLEMDEHGAFWFFTDRQSSKLEYLRAMNLSFIDPAKGTYVSLSGQGEVVTDRAHIDRLWSPMARPWFPDGPDTPNLALLKFVPEAADYWDAPNSSMVRVFGLIASVVAGKPVAMGEHGSIKGLSVPA